MKRLTKVLLIILCFCVMLFYSNISNATDASSLASLGVEKPSNVDEFQIGAYVTFGAYQQTESWWNRSPIEWLVLDKKENKALLISRYGLEARPYDSRMFTKVTWEDCSLRAWLNDEFANWAFTNEEYNAILLTDIDNSKSQGYWRTDGGNNTQDKIFLLSYVEANQYFGVIYQGREIVEARVSPTEHAIIQRAFTSSDNITSEGKSAGSWWLRSPGSSQSEALYVTSNGSIYAFNVDFLTCCVRPALWVNLDSEIFHSEN